MSWRPDKYQPLEHLDFKDVDPAVREELAHHLEARIEENLARGLSREEAVAEARRRFGDLERYRRETAAVEARVQADERRRDRLAVARHEIRRAFRALVRSPSFTVAAVLTLGVGIGATVAIFALLDAVVIRPLPYPDADRIVRIVHPVPVLGPAERWNISTAELVLYEEESRTLDLVGIYGSERMTIQADGQAVQVNAAYATVGALQILGARPAAGRLFSREDSDRGRMPPVLVSERYWRARLGSSPATIGSKVRIEGAETTIVGIVAGDLSLPDWPVDVWIPAQFDRKAPAQNNHTWRALGRLAPGATVAAATRELAGMVAKYSERFPTAYNPRFFDRTGFTTLVLSWKDATVGDTARTLWVLLAAAGLVLVIAAVNVANLFLVRSQTTRREVAVRAMLGANSGQLAWHHFAESALVSAAALAIGLAVGWLGLDLFLASMPAGVERTGAAVPRLAEVTLGWRGAGVATLLALLGAVAFGILARRSDPAAGEAARGSRGSTGSRAEWRIRNGLIVGQMALAVILLAAAGLLIRSFNRLRAVEPGFDPSNLLVVDLALPYNGYGRYPQTTAFYRQVVERMEALPMVERATVGSDLPTVASDGCSLLEYPDRRPEINTSCVPSAVIGPGYFGTLRIPIDGRDLTWSDLDAKTGAAAMTDALARRLFDGGSGVDRAVNGPNDRSAPPFRIVGQSRALRWAGLDQPPTEVAFFPLEPIPGAYLWSPPARMYFVARVRGVDPVSVVPELRRIVREIDPAVAAERPRTMEQVVAGSLVRVRLLTVLLGISAAAALFLSVVGLYGVVAYTVAQRTREIGVRIAIGAPSSTVRGDVVAQSLRLAVAGVVLGLVGSVALSRVLASLLFEVSPNDPITLVATAAILIGVALLASLRPAARAAAIDPIVALRSD